MQPVVAEGSVRDRSVEPIVAGTCAAKRRDPAVRLTGPRECGALACCSKTKFGGAPTGLRDNWPLLYSFAGQLAVRCKNNLSTSSEGEDEENQDQVPVCNDAAHALGCGSRARQRHPRQSAGQRLCTEPSRYRGAIGDGPVLADWLLPGLAGTGGMRSGLGAAAAAATSPAASASAGCTSAAAATPTATPAASAG